MSPEVPAFGSQLPMAAGQSARLQPGMLQRGRQLLLSSRPHIMRLTTPSRLIITIVGMARTLYLL